MSITATEFKSHLGKYLLLAAEEDILITQYGKVVAKLTSPYQASPYQDREQDRVKIAESLFGILPQTMTLDEAKEERYL
ncbi:MAG: type II toxin-antitoxin system prevent-host-death family antitoxin [Synergistaceae bacterium]|nr:type II toxin-antitoxin system prevent-host-death family antitoxin [Synergistaceae bacterium]